MRYLSLIFAFISILIFTAFTAAQTKSDLDRDQLLGPVHTAQLELAEINTVDGKEVELGRHPHQQVVYDQQGHEIERISFDGDGAIESRTVRIIDDKGRISGWKEYEVKAGSKEERLTNRAELFYDEKGNRIKTLVYYGGKLSHQTIASYNDAGLIIEETRSQEDDGEWKETKQYSYDANGHRTKTFTNTNGRTNSLIEVYDDAGHLINNNYVTANEENNWGIKYIFDNKGREIERSSEDSLSQSKIITSYDSRGRILRRITHFEYKQPNMIMSHAPKPGTVEFRYNDSDQLLEERNYSTEGILQHRTVSEYGSDGRMQSQSYFNGDGTLENKVFYEYDQWGNCITTRRIDADYQGNNNWIQHRVITYYNEK